MLIRVSSTLFMYILMIIIYSHDYDIYYTLCLSNSSCLTVMGANEYIGSVRRIAIGFAGSMQIQSSSHCQVPDAL